MSFLTTPDGVRLRLSDRGSGPAIVLVHGWKMSHRVWDRTVAGLEDRFRVVAYDNRGMGESDKPTGRYDFDELGGDLGVVLEQLDLDDVTLVGWSMGCTIALEYRDEMEQRVASLVEERGRCFAALSELDGVTVFPSGANFLLFRVDGDAHKLWELLLDHDVLVRDFSRWPRVEQCLRLTIGTAAENDAFLAALGEALPEVVG